MAKKNPSTALASLYGGKTARAKLAGNVGGQEREQEVLTPPWLLHQLRCWATTLYDGAELEGFTEPRTIVLDPCTTPRNPTDAKVWLTNKMFHPTNPPKGPLDNGLEHSWRDIVEGCKADGVDGFVFVNPPYADLAEWLHKCEIEAKAGVPIYALVPWRSNREWFCNKLYAPHSGGATATTIAPIAFVGSTSGFPAPLCILTWNLPVPDSIMRPAARGGHHEIVTGVYTNNRRWDY